MKVQLGSQVKGCSGGGVGVCDACLVGVYKEGLSYEINEITRE